MRTPVVVDTPRQYEHSVVGFSIKFNTAIAERPRIHPLIHFLLLLYFIHIKSRIIYWLICCKTKVIKHKLIFSCLMFFRLSKCIFFCLIYTFV